MPSIMKPSEHYTQLGQSEDVDLVVTEFEDQGQSLARQRKVFRGWLLVLCGILGGFACIILGYCLSSVFRARAHGSPTTSSTTLTCGNSSRSARESGCIFDLLTNNWMPRYCADPHTDGEYRLWVFDQSRDHGAWAFYYDELAERQVVSEEEISDLVGQHVYTTTENHLAHCIFLARRMHRLVTGEIPAVAHNTFAHTMHCTKAVLKALEMGEQGNGETKLGSTFDVGIVSCSI